jgi:hypothetical protein
MNEYDAIKLNEARVRKHFGEPCPCKCAGHIVELISVDNCYTPEHGWEMVIRLGCDRGCDRIWVRELLEFPSASASASAPGGTIAGMPWIGAILAASCL